MNARRTEDIILDKAARLAVLMELDDAGLLENKSDQQVATVLGINRSTVWRDKQLLVEVRRRRDQLRLKLAV